MQRKWQDAVSQGDVAAVRALIEAGAAIDALDRYGQSGLMRAALGGHTDVVRLLIEHRADLDRQAKYGLTALMLAVVNLHEDVAIALVEAGARLDLTGSGAPGFAGQTALDLARTRDLARTIAAVEARPGPSTGGPQT